MGVRYRRDKHGNTALHVACKMDRDAASSVLLDLGADPGLRDIEQNTALYYMIANVSVFILNLTISLDGPSTSR